MGRLLLALGCLWLFGAAGAAGAAGAEEEAPASSYRLPRSVLPVSYDVELDTNVTRGEPGYRGRVDLELRVTEETERVVLHRWQLRIQPNETRLSRLDDVGGGRRHVSIANQTQDDARQFHVIETQEALTPGRYTLSLRFFGVTNDDVYGFYRSSYKSNNESRWMGVTQFSSTYARRAFPCMDEPGFKATFQLSIKHYANESVASNTLQESRKIACNDSDYYITKFARTPPLPTYLVGWAVHSFRRVDSPVDPRFSLWTRFDDSELPRPASSIPLLNDGPRIFAALEEYTGLPNPLGKVEQFAVPDFHFGAMENWGLVTYREAGPLIWPNVTADHTILKNLATVAHEYAHTWFGNLATPDFFSYVWLKEGFATFFGYYALNKVRPEWRMMDLFPLQVLQVALTDDAETQERTMNGKGVGSPASIQSAFDTITYEKGASVIRMISDVVGPKTFQVAMRSYLKEKQYQTVNPSDIYRHLELALNSSANPAELPVGVSEFIESWASQPNYPLIRASRAGHRRLRITQELFRSTFNDSAESEPRLWWVPVKLAVSSNRTVVESRVWLGSESSVVKLPADTNWFLLNPQQVGYYRVNYDASTWGRLKELLRSRDFRLLPAVNRAALIDDAFQLAKAGYERYHLPLGLARYLEQEDEYEPWIAASKAFKLLDSKLRLKPDVQATFRKYAIDLINPIYKRLNFEEQPVDSQREKMLRNLVHSTACSLNHDDCVSRSKSIFDDWIAAENKVVPANYKDFVYRVGVIKGTNEDWKKLWKRFIETEVHSEKILMMTALAHTKNPAFVKEYLNFSLRNDTGIAKQYHYSIVDELASSNPKNAEIILNYLDSNLKEIMEKGKYVVTIDQLVQAVGNEIVSNEQLEKFTLFTTKNNNQFENTTRKSIEKVIKSAKERITWVNLMATQIANYLG